MSDEVLGGMEDGRGDDPVLDALLSNALRNQALRAAPSEDGLVRRVLDRLSRPFDQADRNERYRIVEQLGRGGMGEVWRAHDDLLDRVVALKVLAPRPDAEPERVQRFLYEARIAGRLQHPACVPIHDCGTLRDGRAFIAMKLVEGQTFSRLLRRRSMPTEDRRRHMSIFDRICQAVAYAHSRGIVHRDLKPANVMVGEFGEVQVMDWGLAKVVGGFESAAVPDHPQTEPTSSRPPHPHRAHSLPGSVMGTPAYMAPEQARGEVARIDRRTDVFQLGAILCEILTGEPPWPGATDREVRDCAAAAHLSDAWRRLDACDADQELRELVRRCLDATPELRPADASEVAASFAVHLSAGEERARVAALDAAAASARTEEAVRTAHAERRARRFVTTTAVLVLICVVGGAATWMTAQQARQERAERLRRQMGDTMAEAALHRQRAQASPNPDPSHWRAAVDAARRCVNLSTEGSAFDETRSRAERLLRELEVELARAEIAARQFDVDSRMRERLEQIRGDHGVHASGRTLIASYGKAIGDYGIDLDALPEALATDKIRASRLAPELIAALDEWAQTGRTFKPEQAPTWDRVSRIADGADGDALRARIRRAARERDRATLLALAASNDLSRLPPSAFELLIAALEAVGERERSLAVRRAAVLAHPADFWLNVALGAALGGTEGIGYYRAALAVRPQSVLARNRLAMSLREGGDIRGARDHFEEIVRLTPQDVNAWTNVALNRSECGDTAAAVAAFERAIELSPENAALRFRLGRELQEHGDHDHALRSYADAIRLDPRDASSLINMAVIHRDRGEMDDALDLHRRAVAARPELPRPHVALASFLRSQHDLDGALVSVGRALELDEGFADAHFEKAIVLCERGEPKPGILEFKRAVSLDPRNATYRFNLGIALDRVGESTEAIDTYREATHIDPHHLGCWINLAACLQASGRYADALVAYRKVKELAAADPTANWPTEDWLNNAELLAGVSRPETGSEVQAIITVCHAKKLDLARARIWKEVFARPELTAELPPFGCRFDAACAAARLGAGRAADAAGLTAESRAEWRAQGLSWLRAELMALVAARESGAIDADAIRQALRGWIEAEDLAPYRGTVPPGLESVPPTEARAWSALWEDVRKHAPGP